MIVEQADAEERRRTRVLLVDDHPLVRAGLAGLLASTDDLVVVGEAADGVACVARAAETDPDVVLMDLSMPGADGVEGTRALLDSGFRGAIIVLTSFTDASRVREAVAAGAVGFLLKDSDPADVLSGIRAAAAGYAPLDPRAARALLPPREPSAQPGADLSVREREVLDLIAEGRANKQIARALGISERTVKVHVGNVFRRIGVQDRTSAALWAREHLS